MAGYFNKTRGLVTVSLRNGESAIVGPKQTMIVSPEQDGSASLHAMVRRGLLVRLKTPSTPVAKTAPKPVPSSVPTTPVESVKAPSLEWKKSTLVEHAEALGLEVPASWTKVEILEAIEEAGL